MRMWMIDPKLLCRQHLLGEHNEIHKFRHNFVKGHSMAGRAGQIEPRSMQTRHDELAAEMIRRGYRHKSPYEQPDVSRYADMPDVSPFMSASALMHRCIECEKNINHALCHCVCSGPDVTQNKQCAIGRLSNDRVDQPAPAGGADISRGVQ